VRIGRLRANIPVAARVHFIISALVRRRIA
jgi:hypothetical protein